ncbi:MAG TPA: hypothetical protein VIV40_01240 [Kofleriaceae bacterium]
MVLWVSTTIAFAKPRKDALLVSPPQVSVMNASAADLIYASILAGLHDGLKRRMVDTDRQFVAVFTERSILNEEKTKTAPVVLFSRFTSHDLGTALEKHFLNAQEFRLARLLEISIAELSPANYEVGLVLYDPNNWKIVLEKQIGGCNESLEELSATARELASKLIEPAGTPVAPQPTIELQPAAAGNTFIVGTRITLDSCGINNSGGDPLNVTWKSTRLPRDTHRRRVSLMLDRPEIFDVEQQVMNEVSTVVTIKVIAPPKAQPIVETCSKAEMNCKEALFADESAEATKPTVAQVAFQGRPENQAVQSTAEFLARRAREETEEFIEANYGSDMPRSSSAHRNSDLRVIRLEPGINHVRLQAKGIEPNQAVQWTQISGPTVKDVDLTQRELNFQLTTSNSGYYVFKLVVKAGSTASDEAKISFLAAPAIHADAGHATSARVGESVLLDASGSYDVLGDQVTYTWVLTDERQHGTARIIDSHTSRPRFIAQEPGDYNIRLYARVVRKIDDASLVEIELADTTVKVTRTDVQFFIDSYSSATTRETFRAGALWTPAIRSLSTIARTFSYRRIFGGAVGTDRNGYKTFEGILGLGLRLRDRLLIDVYGRFYSKQEEDNSHEVAFGVGSSLSLSVVGKLWFQIKLNLGPPSLYTRTAPHRFAWDPGVGLAYEL